jgi:hypothetical protein
MRLQLRVEVVNDARKGSLKLSGGCAKDDCKGTIDEVSK